MLNTIDAAAWTRIDDHLRAEQAQVEALRPGLEAAMQRQAAAAVPALDLDRAIPAIVRDVNFRLSHTRDTLSWLARTPNAVINQAITAAIKASRHSDLLPSEDAIARSRGEPPFWGEYLSYCFDATRRLGNDMGKPFGVVVPVVDEEFDRLTEPVNEAFLEVARGREIFGVHSLEELGEVIPIDYPLLRQAITSFTKSKIDLRTEVLRAVRRPLDRIRPDRIGPRLSRRLTRTIAWSAEIEAQRPAAGTALGGIPPWWWRLRNDLTASDAMVRDAIRRLPWMTTAASPAQAIREHLASCQKTTADAMASALRREGPNIHGKLALAVWQLRRDFEIASPDLYRFYRDYAADVWPGQLKDGDQIGQRHAEWRAALTRVEEAARALRPDQDAA